MRWPELDMNPAELARALFDIRQALDDRIEIWSVVIEPDGTVGGRIYHGSFQERRESSREESPRQRE